MWSNGMAAVFAYERSFATLFTASYPLGLHKERSVKTVILIDPLPAVNVINLQLDSCKLTTAFEAKVTRLHWPHVSELN